MGKEFDFRKLDYVEFEFNSPDGIDTPEGEPGQLSKAWLLHDQYVSDLCGDSYMNMEDFTEKVLFATELAATNSDIENVRTEKGDSEPGVLGIKVYSGDEYLGQANLDVRVMAERYIMNLVEEEGVDPEEADIPNLPNGDPITEMDNYTWEDFEKLEQLAQSQRDAEFASGIDSIEGPDEGLNK